MLIKPTKYKTILQHFQIEITLGKFKIFFNEFEMNVICKIMCNVHTLPVHIRKKLIWSKSLIQSYVKLNGVNNFRNPIHFNQQTGKYIFIANRQFHGLINYVEKIPKITSLRFILNIFSTLTEGHLCLTFDLMFSQSLLSSSSSLLSSSVLLVFSESHLFVKNITSSGLKHGISLSICRSNIDLSISGSCILNWKKIYMTQARSFSVKYIIHRYLKPLHFLYLSLWIANHLESII